MSAASDRSGAQPHSASALTHSAGGRPAPLVSVILTTRDRPRFLKIALRCFAHQTYAPRELVVVDDGMRWPADQEAITAVGGRLIRVEPGTPLGTKLNRGIAESAGLLCQKMDDDDWYAPAFLERLVQVWQDSQRRVSWPLVMGCAPHQLFDLHRWEIRSNLGGVAGGTLFFTREVWEQCPFRDIVKAEDGWFILDQRRLGVRLLTVDGAGAFLLVRHRSVSVDRGHTWRYWAHQTVEEVFQQLPAHDRPEAMLPAWAIEAYSEIRGGRPAPVKQARPQPGERLRAALSKLRQSTG